MTPHCSSSRRLRAGQGRWSALAGVVAVAVLGTGCMTSKVEETRQVAAAIHAGESIATNGLLSEEVLAITRNA